MSNTKTKSDLVDAVASKSGLTKADAGKAIDAVIASVTDILKGGDELNLVGFGKFSTKKNPARKGRNPSTGAEIDIAANTAPKFAPGKALKDAVNV
ncbi:HU family DNA-binding protein [Pararhizobium sp. BT-229]|uniref:HU family DNA-binding protein n=1 Tax=Pararhizobium sp. BT-229 TaxID=2986923 RepID=UPI0021F6AC8A|nr:HU family DNA-binding protein [Pararhizobium sp. BT-229]MCV9964650.1 HU family DNA-binding protein [Pararhizobium sp. BT-229]